jgi:hypothetical protein
MRPKENKFQKARPKLPFPLLARDSNVAARNVNPDRDGFARRRVLSAIGVARLRRVLRTKIPHEFIVRFVFERGKLCAGGKVPTWRALLHVSLGTDPILIVIAVVIVIAATTATA